MKGSEKLWLSFRITAYGWTTYFVITNWAKCLSPENYPAWYLLGVVWIIISIVLIRKGILFFIGYILPNISKWADKNL